MKTAYSKGSLTVVILTLAGLLLLLAPALLAAPDDNSADAAFRQAWERATAIGRFHFDTTTRQTIHPTAHPDNIGRRAATSRFDLQGDIDQPARQAQLQIWPNGRERAETLTLRIDNGRATARIGEASEWVELDNGMDLFVRNGDPLGYLAAAENVRLLDAGAGEALFPTELLPDALAASVTRYRFDLNGPQYARTLRDALEAELRRNGRLPAGLSLSMVQEIVDMAGEGELWLDANGLPYRQLLQLRLPPDVAGREWVELQITTDYSGWSASPGVADLDWGRPAQALAGMLRLAGVHPDDVARSLLGLGYALLVAAAAVALARYGQDKRVRASFTVLIITSLLAVPLLQVNAAETFRKQQTAGRVAEPAPDAGTAAQTPGDGFRPTVNPLASRPGLATAGAAAQAATNCIVGEATDCDGDGLQDKVEIFELGTFADDVDSDDDGISDGVEVAGFSAGGQTWYMNPRDPDSNHDGLPDGLECSARYNINANGAIETSVTATTCADSDKDGVPDVWDYDNDKDGVPDSVDDDPYTFHTVVDQQFGLTLAGYEKGKSLLVDVTVRPTNDQHLWWTNTYLDWPDLDQHGQITRVTTDTLGTDGDMLLSPLLEITIPYSSENPSRGLPVKSGVNSATITATEPISSWLDTDTLDLYGLTVTQDENGTLVVYAPLNVTRDVVGDTPVAWSARLYYEMSTAATGWGDDHEIKVLWTVNGLVDQCTPPDGETFADYCDVGSNRENTTNLSHWTKSQNVYQTYYDDFIVTALGVQEEDEVYAAVMAQKPGASGASAHYDNYLWHLAETLEETFLQAQLIAGNRMDVDDIGTQYANWGIPAAAIAFEALGPLGDTTDLLAAVQGDEIINRLDSIYPSAANGDTATLLFAGEKTVRAVGLDDESTLNQQRAADSFFTLDLSTATPAITGFLRWAPYAYDGVTWSNLDLVTARETLASDLAPVFTATQVQSLAGGDSGYDELLAQAGAVNLAVNYYTSLYSGAVTLLQSGNTVFSSGTLDNGAHALPAEPVVAVVDDLLDDIQGFYSRISLNNLTLTATLYDELQTIAVNSWTTLANGRGHILEALGQRVDDLAATSTSVALNQIQYAPQLSGDLNSLLNAGALDYVYKSTIGEAQSYGPLGNAAGITYYAGYRGVYRVYSAYKYFNGVTPEVPRLMNTMIEDYQTWLWLAYAGRVGLAVGSFALAWGEGKITPGSPEFAEKLAFEISNIIVDTIVFVIVSVATTGIVLGALAVLNVIDAVIALICDAAHVKPGSQTDQWVCGGITGALVKALTYVINDYTELADLTHDGRLENDMATPTVTQTGAAPGFAAGNTIHLTATITSTLYFGHPNWMGYAYADTQLTDDNLDDSTFDYELQTTPADISLNLNGTSWTAIGGSGVSAGGIPTGPRFRHTGQTSVGYVVTADEAGVNTGLTVYLAEGYAMKAQDCWLIVDPVCWIETTRDTNQTDLSNDLIFDLFPETLDEFHALSLVNTDSYQLAWDSSFPALADADGDGVRSKLAGGADPDDSAADSDRDGLGDGFEQQYGFDPTTADGDSDGLTDYWEAFFLTDPYQADSDGDGLIDSEEVFHPNRLYPYENSTLSDTKPPPSAPKQSAYAGGWEIVYAYDGATPLKSWVSANPRDYDSDDDGIDDLREEIYGYNPLAASTLAVLSLHSSVQAGSGSTTYPIPYATLGSTIDYTAEVTNELTDRWARGLLQGEFPTDIIRSTTEMGVVQPQETVTLNGSTSAANSGLSAGGTVSLTLRSGAVVVGDDDRVLWLHLNEAAGATTFTDSSVYDHEVKCTACPTANGDYLSFSPTSNNAQQLLVVPTQALTPSSFSVGLWVKVNTPGIITLYEMETVAGGVGESNFALNLTNSAIDLIVQKSIYTTNQTVAGGRWNHIMVTYDGSSKQTTLYINGSQKWQEDTSTIHYGSFLFDFLIGAGNSGTSFDLDEVEVYDRVLDAFEVEQLFGQPVLDINFATLTDESPSGNSLSCAAGSTCPTTSTSGGAFAQKQYVNATGSALDFSGDAFTFSAWINPQTRGTPFDHFAVSAYNNLVGASPRVDDSAYDWQGVFGAADSSNHAKVAPTLLVNPKGQMRLFMGNGTNTCHLDTAEGLIDYGTWQHVTVSYDGDTAAFYLNGVPVAQSNMDCANITPANLGQITVGRGSALGTLYWRYVEIDGHDSGDFELRINFDDDSSAGNIWEGSAESGKTAVANITKAYFIPDDNSHWWHFWEDDSSPSNADYHHCSVGCDDSYVKETVTNTGIGSFSSDFDQVDITEVDNASGTLYWTLSNDFFVGGIDEFKAYVRAFTDEEALQLYEASYDGMYYTFDEPPGANTFADAYDDSVPASCDYAAGNCPDSGIAGISNQAAGFDGSSDYLQLPQTNLLKTLDAGFTVAAWINPDSTSGIRRIMAAARQASANGFGFGLNGDKLLFTTFGVKDYNSSATITAGQWQHVAVVFDDNFDATFYLNGSLIDTVTGSAPAAGNADDPYRVGATTVANSGAIDERFSGRIDELIVETRPLDATGVQRLMNNAPMLTLHLDEDLNTEAFADEVGVANFAVCESESACPGAGDKGQIREAVVFDGIDDVLSAPIYSYSEPFFPGLSEFTVALWVNPTEIKSDYQPLAALESPTGGDRNFGLFIHPGSMDVHMSMSNSACTAYVARTVFDNPLLQHQWNHVAFTFDGTTQRLYINGTERGSHVPGDTPCLSSYPVKIGGELNAFTPFAGGIDELTVYGRALSGLEVADTFSYQSAWFDVKETHPITIDDDNPTVSLDRATPYLPPGETVIKIAAQDPTSEITRVRYAVSGYTGALDATNTDGVWTFVYDFQDEGTYNIVLEATDSVGHVTATNNTLIVDTLSPTGAAGSVPPHTVTDGIIFWSNIFVEDRASTIGANSGVDPTSVMVTVRDRHGAILGAPTPARWDVNDIYSVQLPFPFSPYGEYTFTVSFADMVGNRGSFDQLAVLEDRGPHADALLHANTTITPGLTITGIASDVEHVWPNRSLHLHFEEAAGSQTFVDPSRNELVADCSAAPSQCPTAGVSGYHGSAIRLDGSQSLTLEGSVGASDTITTPLESRLGLYNDSFTVMAWVNATSWSQTQALLGLAAADGNDMTIGFLNGRPGIGLAPSSVAAAQALPTGQWSHVAYSYDIDTGAVVIYVNGNPVQSADDHLPYTGEDVEVTVGQLRGTEHFNGLIDELVIYPQALTADQIYDIANPVQSGLEKVEVRFRHVNEQDQTEQDGAWDEATFTTGTSSDIHRLWTYTVPAGLSGSYKIDVRVTDSFGVTQDTAERAADVVVLNNVRFVPGVWTGFAGDETGRGTQLYFPVIGGRP